ncbi:MAG: hypothetical protein ACRDSI_19940 [Pseudonocardiaceae bacterium]
MQEALRPSPSATPYREYRLWRNDPRIRFEGVIHEKVVPAIQRAGPPTNPAYPAKIALARAKATRA